MSYRDVTIEYLNEIRHNVESDKYLFSRQKAIGKIFRNLCNELSYVEDGDDKYTRADFLLSAAETVESVLRQLEDDHNYYPHMEQFWPEQLWNEPDYRSDLADWAYAAFEMLEDNPALAGTHIYYSSMSGADRFWVLKFRRVLLDISRCWTELSFRNLNGASSGESVEETVVLNLDFTRLTDAVLQDIAERAIAELESRHGS